MILRALFVALSMLVARGLVCLGYGKKGMDARKYLGISSKGITMVWDLYIWVMIVVLIIAGTSEIPLTVPLVFVIGAIPYILWLVRARLSVPDLLSQVETIKRRMEKEEEKKKAEIDAQRAQLEAEQIRKEEEKQRKLDAIRQQLAQSGTSESFSGFVEVASNCKKIAEIRTAWNAWPKDGIDRPLQEEVKNRLDRLGSQEMIYGTSERRTNDLMKELRGLAGL